MSEVWLIIAVIDTVYRQLRPYLQSKFISEKNGQLRQMRCTPKVKVKTFGVHLICRIAVILIRLNQLQWTNPFSNDTQTTADLHRVLASFQAQSEHD